MARTRWKPSMPGPNPFVRVGVPQYIGGRFAERQQLVDWVHNNERGPLLVGGCRGSGKSTLVAWLENYLTFDPEQHFTDTRTLIPAQTRGEQDTPILDQVIDRLDLGDDRTITSEVSAGFKIAGGKRSESLTPATPRSLLSVIPRGHLIIVDEAQSLNHHQLSELADFLERAGEHFDGKVLMLGTPHLLTLHPPDGTFGLFGRCPTIRLQPTQSDDETADTITGTTDLAADHEPSKQFSDAAINKIHTLTQGYPAALQVACYYAYQTAPGTTVKPEHVDLEPRSPAWQHLSRTFDQMIRKQGSVGREPVLRQAVLAHLAAHGPTTPLQLANALNRANGNSLGPALNHLKAAGIVDNDVQTHEWRIIVPLLDRHLHAAADS